MVGQKLLKWGVFLIVLGIIGYSSIFWFSMMVSDADIRFRDERIVEGATATFSMIIVSIIGIIGYLAFMR